MSTEPPIEASLFLDESGRLPTGRFRRACRDLALSSFLEQALLVSERDMVGGDWSSDSALATLIAEHVRRTCNPTKEAVQIQYVHLGDPEQAFLLYVKPFDGYLLTLAAEPDVTLMSLRWAANSLADISNDGDDGESATSTERAGPFNEAGKTASEASYAIAWRPIEPLPQAVRRIIRNSVERLARREGCYLSFLGVASDHVHLVLRCPPRRKGSWAAYTFKAGIEEDIAQRYGTPASLWKKGFLADPSGEPFAAEALLAYLNY